MADGKNASYRDLLQQAEGLLQGIRDPIANAANIAALLWYGLPDLNWVGFYFARDNGLLLGPFQGKPACVRIPWGKGVCGTAAVSRQTLIVTDVHAFDGHIACDSASNAEVVVPLIADGEVLGVLDLDSPVFGRFDEIDAAGLQAIAQVWVAGSDRF